jgi:uncharacterized protein (DUF58 family)
MIETDFLHQLDRFSLIINKRVTSNYTGERRTSEIGRGLIFKDHQIYVPGEDFRSIDWKVFGRTDKLFIKRYEEERNLTIHVLLDFSGSMGFGRGSRKKCEFASMIGIGFAYMALKNNERFVLSTFSDSLEFFKPKRGKKQLMSILEFLNMKKPKGDMKLDEASSLYYKKVSKQRSMMVIVSDFLYPIEEIRNCLYRFKNNDLILIQVLDTLERDLKLDGDFRLNDVETNQKMRTFISPYLKKNYEKMLNDHIARINNACEEVGAEFYSSNTGQEIFDVFYDVLGG